jgi:hypothetical protein
MFDPRLIDYALFVLLLTLTPGVDTMLGAPGCSPPPESAAARWYTVCCRVWGCR